MKQLLGRLWCNIMHRGISHPIHGQYRCWTCLRVFHTEW